MTIQAFTLNQNEPHLERESMRTRVALHPFLAGMNPRQLALLTDCAIPVHFRKGQTILREEEMANRFYLIESGKVVLESGEGFGDPVIVETIRAGDLLGWSWMFPPYTWHFTARAAEPTEAIFFYGTILREYCERSLVRLRVVQANHTADAETLAGSPPKDAVRACSPCRVGTGGAGITILRSGTRFRRGG